MRDRRRRAFAMLAHEFPQGLGGEAEEELLDLVVGNFENRHAQIVERTTADDNEGLQLNCEFFDEAHLELIMVNSVEKHGVF